jgi:molecular chaperone DnaK (HSP70)
MTVNPDEVVALGAAVQVKNLYLFTRLVCWGSSNCLYFYILMDAYKICSGLDHWF